MRRGEIRYAELDPSRGAEANKKRPVLIVSSDGMNRTVSRLGRGVVTIVPLTSNTERVYDFQTLLSADQTGLPLDSKAQCEQVRSIDASRLDSRPTSLLVPELMAKVDAALRLHLSL